MANVKDEPLKGLDSVWFQLALAVAILVFTTGIMRRAYGAEEVCGPPVVQEVPKPARILDEAPNGHFTINTTEERGLAAWEFAGATFYTDETVSVTLAQRARYVAVVRASVNLASERMGHSPLMFGMLFAGYRVYIVAHNFDCPLNSGQPPGTLCVGLTDFRERKMWIRHRPCAADTSMAHELSHLFHLAKDGTGDHWHRDTTFFYEPGSLTEDVNARVDPLCE